jgi:adenylylsulfate kinase
METSAKEKKEQRLKQKGKVIWLTGLSGSGKTTIAVELEKYLFNNGYIAILIDGDILRAGLNSNLGFSLEDRNENIRRAAEVSKLFIHTGIICITSFITPTEETRHIARSIIGKDDFIEVFLDTPLDICEKRDVKGLYKKARKGEIPDFTGISSPYEIPLHPNIKIRSYNRPVEESAHELYEYILPEISLKPVLQEQIYQKQ